MVNDWTMTRDKFLDRQERKKLLAACRIRAESDLFKGRITWPKRYMLVDLALYTGLRVSEITNLRIKHLHVNAEDSYLAVINGKGKKHRTVYVDDALADHLREYLDLKQKSWQEPTDSDAVFLSKSDGHSYTVMALQKSFKRAIQAAGLNAEFSIHSARHTYATFLLHDTQNIRYVQRQLGHSSLSVTEVYADILPEENGKLANQISRD